MDVGTKLKEARRAVSMTQEEVAEKLGVSRQSISNWENGRTYPDIVSVVRMSELYNISLDALLKEEKAVSNYLEYLDESTNVVRSREKQGRLLVILTYLAVWGLGMIVFWFLSSGSDGMGFSLMYLWFLLPVMTLVLSIIIGRNDYWERGKWFAAPVFGLMYMLAEYATFSLANMVAFQKLNIPYFGMIPVGAGISLLGLGIGSLLRRMAQRKKAQGGE
ncbi:MAG: helix-turn-helix transcriptional regulator [Bacillota bacterium]|nr:helix-turn-helix transcriptional regulator [Bacillota bacterium]